MLWRISTHRRDRRYKPDQAGSGPKNFSFPSSKTDLEICVNTIIVIVRFTIDALVAFGTSQKRYIMDSCVSDLISSFARLDERYCYKVFV